MGSSIVLGVVLACCTTFLSAMGLTLQKKALSRLAESRGGGTGVGPRLRSYHSPLWLAGLACIVVSALASIGVSGLLGQFLASSFACCTLVWAALLRHFFLHEPLYPIDYLIMVALCSGTLAIVFGRSVLGTSAPPSTLFSPAQLASTLNNWRTAVFAGAWFFCFAALWTSSWRTWCRLACLLGLAALFGALTGVCSKAVGSLLSFAVGGGAGAAGLAVGSFLLWLFVAILLGSVVLQMGYLNEGLKEGTAATVVPVYQGLFLLSGLVSGLVLWREDEGLRSPAAGGCVAAGVLLILAGLALVARRKPPPLPAPLLPPHALQQHQRRAAAQAARIRRCTSAPAALCAGASPAALKQALGPCAAGDSLQSALRHRGVRGGA